VRVKQAANEESKRLAIRSKTKLDPKRRAMAEPAASAERDPGAHDPDSQDPDSQNSDSQDLAVQLNDFLVGQLLQAEKLLSKPGKARHKGVHEGRKCMRRARAALALGGSRLGPLAERLDLEIGRICRGLSSLRDAQALIEALQRLPRDSSDSAPMLAGARAAAERDRDLRLKRGLALDPDFGRRRKRLLRVLEGAKKLDWSGVSAARLHKAIARSEKRLEKSARVVKKRPDDDLAWHRMRRRLRRLRQQLNILEKIFPTHSFDAGKAKDIQARAAQLGESQDDSLLLARCGKGSPFDPKQRVWLRAVTRSRLAHARGRHRSHGGLPPLA